MHGIIYAVLKMKRLFNEISSPMKNALQCIWKYDERRTQEKMKAFTQN
jgi:hypothetical protein